MGFHGLVFCFLAPLLKTRLTVRSFATATDEMDSVGIWLISMTSVDNEATGRANTTAAVEPAATAFTGGNAAGWRATVVGSTGTAAWCCGPRSGTRGFMIGTFAGGMRVCSAGALGVTTASLLELLGAIDGWLLFVVFAILLTNGVSDNCVPCGVLK